MKKRVGRFPSSSTARAIESPGEFASIGVGQIERPLRMKNVALRGEYGSTADLSDPYVDAIVINAYSGPGTGSLTDGRAARGRVDSGRRWHRDGKPFQS